MCAVCAGLGVMGVRVAPIPLVGIGYWGCKNGFKAGAGFKRRIDQLIHQHRPTNPSNKTASPPCVEQGVMV